MTKTIQSVDVYGKTFTVPVTELTWRPSAYGIVIKDNKILLSPQFDNRYDLPGGGSDLGELLEETVIREVKEETGLEVDNPEIITVTSNFFTFTHSDNSTAACIMVYYLCELVGGKLSTDGFDAEEKKYARQAVWLPLSELDDIELASSFDWRPAVKKAVQHAHSRD